MLDLGVAGLKPFIRTIGLFNTKAENIIKTCRILVEEHDSQVPADRKPFERGSKKSIRRRRPAFIPTTPTG